MTVIDLQAEFQCCKPPFLHNVDKGISLRKPDDIATGKMLCKEANDNNTKGTSKKSNNSGQSAGTQSMKRKIADGKAEKVLLVVSKRD